MDKLHLERQDRVLVITLNRPDALNALDAETAEALLIALRQLDDDPALAVGVLCGAGRGFCAGMDLKEFLAEGPPAALAELVRIRWRKPLVAAVEGFALAGGLELALTCDLLVAARGAKLGVPEVAVGLFAAAGALYRLPARLPQAIASELALTGAPMLAERAHALGLVNRLVEPGEALEAAVELAAAVAANAPLAVQASKELLAAAGGCREEEFWDLQEPVIERVFHSADGQEGPTAFVEKRPASWTGR